VKVGIVGCGEVGRAYAAASAAAGYQVVLVDPHPSAATVAVADQIGVPVYPSADGVVGDVDRLWICVAGDLVSSVCRSLRGQLPATAVVADLTTAAPEDKRACAGLLAMDRIDYVDVVIMGSVAVTGARTALLAAGSRAEEVLVDFAKLGAAVRVMSGGRPGDAATVKLLRTILTKGLESLAVECFIAAEQQGLRDDLYDVLGDVDASGFVSFLEMLVTSHVQHADRRLNEVRRAQDQLTDMGCSSVVLPGSEARFALTVQALKDGTGADMAAGDVDSAVSWLLRTARPEATSA
jgi:3-hydroxyisobutyrate dehydrogenase